jgi:nicotinamidase-related amidase
LRIERKPAAALTIDAQPSFADKGGAFEVGGVEELKDAS